MYTSYTEEISNRRLFAAATNMDEDFASHRAVHLDCVILFSNSISRAQIDLDLATYERLLSCSTS